MATTGKVLKRKQDTTSVESFFATLTELTKNKDFHSVAASLPHFSNLVKDISHKVRHHKLNIVDGIGKLLEALDSGKDLKADNSVVQLATNFCQNYLLENISLPSSTSLLSDCLEPIQSFTKKQIKICHSHEKHTFVKKSDQRHLAEVIRSIFSDKLQIASPYDDEDKDLLNIRNLSVGKAFREYGYHFQKVIEQLEKGELHSWTTISKSVEEEFWECYGNSNFIETFSKQAKPFLTALLEFLNEILEKVPTVDQAPETLPASILANQEPYLDCEWRKEPIEKRLYEEIRTYHFLEGENEMSHRLQTCKGDGLSEDFFINNDHHFTLEFLNTKEQSLIESVKAGRVLNKGEDIIEKDTWGMDCYSRRNIYDAILELNFSLEQISEWFQRVLAPAINQQGSNGWNLKSSLDWILNTHLIESTDYQMAKIVKQRLGQVGDDYFRIHPKGTGIICVNEDGLEAFTLVEEYLGILHSPWRWFEIQDYLKKQMTNKLPDFYNIVLERPKDDPKGYQVSFVDAAAKGTLASRISHSCEPNCQVVVVSVAGRLTIAMYTTRYIQKGEELSFDYSSVTESEKEYRLAICLCSSLHCRGSFLYFAGSGAFMHIMSSKHNFLHRNAILLKSTYEPLTSLDQDLLQSHGLKEACLGTHGISRVPQWLEKWAALILQYVELECELLPRALLEEGLLPEDASSHAKGLRDNRLQNIAITIDKVRMYLGHASHPEIPPIQKLNENDVLQHLWTGEKSVAKRFLRAFLDTVISSVSKDWTQLLTQLTRLANGSPLASSLATLFTQDVKTVYEAKEKLLEIEKALRSANTGNTHTAAADILHLYATTETFFSPGFKHKGFTSDPLTIQLNSISGASTSKHIARNEAENSMIEEPICKKYGAQFLWGQLVIWYKQTVNDPTASLSAERRGSLSLPDIESCYSRGYMHYASKERCNLLDQLENRPDAMWKVGTIFSFRNEMKIYGSPMLDAAFNDKNHNLESLVDYFRQMK